MGRDYLIHIYLEIQHSNGIAFYELPTIGGYYSNIECGFYDSDYDEDNQYYRIPQYRELKKKYYEFCLTPKKPLVIFENGEFINDKLKQKYLPMVINNLNHVYLEKFCINKEDIGELKDINDILIITKKEVRYEMGEGPPLYNPNRSKKVKDKTLI